jgi:hypothetical protein
MESINNLFEVEINGVTHAYPSIYNKSDVSELLSRLKDTVLKLIEEEKPETPELTAFKLDVLQAFRHELDDNRYGEYVDQDSAEFNISYDNRIELSNIDINTDELENALERAFERVEAGN